MHSSKCRELKREVMKRAYSDDVRCHAGKGAPLSQSGRPLPVAAVGTTGDPSRPGDEKLVVRIYQGCEACSSTLLEGLETYLDEVDIETGVYYEPLSLTLHAGTSCTLRNAIGGTLGCFVEDDNKKRYLLSNSHVLTQNNRGNIGDEIVQPGPGIDKVIGFLHSWYALSETDHSGVDAAIAEINARAVRITDPRNFPGIGAISTKPSNHLERGRKVVKLGATTGVTYGTIVSADEDGIFLNYGTRTNPEYIIFDDQIEILGDTENMPFSQAGDSGALVVDHDTKEPLGLIFAAKHKDNGTNSTIAHYLPTVLNALNVRMA